MTSKYEYLHLNSREGQIKILKNDASLSQKSHIEEAFPFVVGNGKIKEKDNVDEIVGRIYSLAELLIKGDSDPANLVSAFYEYYCIADEIIKEILPSIERLRQELFSKTDPPFLNNPRKAFNWLEKEAEKEAVPFCQRNIKNKKKIDEMHDEIREKINEFSKLTNIRYMLRGEKRLLPYPGEKGYLKKIDVWINTPLAKLEEETKRLFNQTGLTQESLILFILTGIKPVFLAYRITKTFPLDKTKRINLNLEIYRPLRKKTFLEIYTNVKQAFGKGRKQFLEKKHYELKELVEKHGGPPRKNKEEFWQQIRKEINQKYPNWFNDERANGPRITYKRIKESIQTINKFPNL